MGSWLRMGIRHNLKLEESDLVDVNIMTARSLLTDACSEKDFDRKIKKLLLSYYRLEDVLRSFGVIDET